MSKPVVCYHIAFVEAQSQATSNSPRTQININIYIDMYIQYVHLYIFTQYVCIAQNITQNWYYCYFCIKGSLETTFIICLNKYLQNYCSEANMYTRLQNGQQGRNSYNTIIAFHTVLQKCNSKNMTFSLGFLSCFKLFVFLLRFANFQLFAWFIVRICTCSILCVLIVCAVQCITYSVDENFFVNLLVIAQCIGDFQALNVISQGEAICPSLKDVVG
eukprot:TRINITY_DN1913_c1_g1_i2.p3 TRINITY_DN1913_c1_g1~~TRINITY_DN1913_c1_g1_i2.p3  ORF type:complete len:217 (+),score=-12.25 TRINITY_DN1913_c1_g1_i2:167-817(+)